MSSAYEHAYYPRGPVAGAPTCWPGGQAVAVAFVVSVEYYDLHAPAHAFVPANVPGGFGRGPYPDLRAYSLREYGARVGWGRVLRAFAGRGLRATLAADAHTALHRGAIVERALEAGWALAAHGMSGTHAISSRMSEAEEGAYIDDALAALERHGALLRGWHGIEYAQSARTPRLLAERGIGYQLDWPLDDRPVPMRVPSGRMLAVPMSADHDDVLAHWNRKIAMARWARGVLEAVDTLAAEPDRAARCLVVNLHPWLIGQPSRIGYLEQVLDSLAARRDTRLATTDEIADWAAPAGR